LCKKGGVGRGEKVKRDEGKERKQMKGEKGTFRVYIYIFLIITYAT